MPNSQPIGVLDSGVGGLTVLKELQQLLPHENFSYLGDSGRAPYGPRPVEEIQAFTEQMIDFLLTKNVKAVVLACNTITVNCLPALQAKYSIPIIGMNLANEAANQISKKKSIAILGTAATIASGKHKEALEKTAPDARIHAIPCYDFAALVEAGHIGDEKAMDAISQYLSPVRGDADAVILGCTHYPFLAADIQSFMGDSATVIDPAALTSEDTLNVLKSHGLLNESSETGKLDICFTGDLDQPKNLAKMAFQKEMSITSHQW